MGGGRPPGSATVSTVMFNSNACILYYLVIAHGQSASDPQSARSCGTASIVLSVT